MGFTTCGSVIAQYIVPTNSTVSWVGISAGLDYILDSPKQEKKCLIQYRTEAKHTYSLRYHREKSANYKDCESQFPLLFQPMEKFKYGCVSISHQIYNTACSLHLDLVISTFYTTLSQQLYNG